MRRSILWAVLVSPLIAMGIWLQTSASLSIAFAQNNATVSEVPQFAVDPSWPKIPNNWVLGLVSGVNVDAQDHIWVLHRPRTVKAEQHNLAAPPVLEFDAQGDFIQGWGGPGEGYEWPGTEHGISIDHKGFVWIGGSGTGRGAEPGDDEILKFTARGKFVMQIGRRGQSKGNTDSKNVHGAADVTVYPPTNEVFVADGYGNRRVIVFDADTGAFKRMWSAFGNVPTDPSPSEKAAAGVQDDEGPGAPQFNLVHAARISNDGLVYVSDRMNKRVQVFTPAGHYITQVFLSRGKMPLSSLPGIAFGKPIRELADGLVRDGMSASRTAFSPDPAQKYLYVIDRIKQQIVILDRRTLTILGSFGDGPGSAPGQFYILHDIAVDSNGNVYTAEVNEIGNRRAQKFVFKGMVKGTRQVSQQ
jgi:DNA-binding beta-propeller fold protein YncE